MCMVAKGGGCGAAVVLTAGAAAAPAPAAAPPPRLSSVAQLGGALAVVAFESTLTRGASPPPPLAPLPLLSALRAGATAACTPAPAALWSLVLPLLTRRARELTPPPLVEA